LFATPQMIYKAEQSACAVQFSPFVSGRVAAAFSQNFAIVGNGRVSVLQGGDAGFEHVVSFDTIDGGPLSCSTVASDLLRAIYNSYHTAA
jgi:hypothetical protein